MHVPAGRVSGENTTRREPNRIGVHLRGANQVRHRVPHADETFVENGPDGEADWGCGRLTDIVHVRADRGGTCTERCRSIVHCPTHRGQNRINRPRMNASNSLPNRLYCRIDHTESIRLHRLRRCCGRRRHRRQRGRRNGCNLSPNSRRHASHSRIDDRSLLPLQMRAHASPRRLHGFGLRSGGQPVGGNVACHLLHRRVKLLRLHALDTGGDVSDRSVKSGNVGGDHGPDCWNSRPRSSRDWRSNLPTVRESRQCARVDLPQQRVVLLRRIGVDHPLATVEHRHATTITGHPVNTVPSFRARPLTGEATTASERRKTPTSVTARRLQNT